MNEIAEFYQHISALTPLAQCVREAHSPRRELQRELGVPMPCIAIIRRHAAPFPIAGAWPSMIACINWSSALPASGPSLRSFVGSPVAM